MYTIYSGPDLPIGQVGHGLGPTEFGGPLKPIYRAKISNWNVEILLTMWWEACRNTRTPCFGAHIVGLYMGPSARNVIGPCFVPLDIVWGPMFEHGPSFRTFWDHGSLFWAHTSGPWPCVGTHCQTIFRPMLDQVPTVSGLFLDYF